MSSYRLTVDCPAGCGGRASLNDSGYPDEHDEHRSVTEMIEHLASEHPEYVETAWAAKAVREYYERVILPAHVRRIETELSERLPDGLSVRFDTAPFDPVPDRVAVEYVTDLVTRYLISDEPIVVDRETWEQVAACEDEIAKRVLRD